MTFCRYNIGDGVSAEPVSFQTGAAACVAFWDSPATKTCVAFLDMSHGGARQNALHSTPSFWRSNCACLLQCVGERQGEWEICQ